MTLEEIDEVVAQVQGIDPAVAVRPFTVEIQSQTPVAVTLDRYFAPGVLALMLQHLGLTFAALALVRERRAGTLELLRVSPATTGERLAGKTLAFLLLGAIAAAGLTALIVAVFGVPLPVHWLTFIGLLAMTLLASIGLGFLVASVSASDSQAVQTVDAAAARDDLLLRAVHAAGPDRVPDAVAVVRAAGDPRLPRAAGPDAAAAADPPEPVRRLAG